MSALSLENGPYKFNVNNSFTESTSDDASRKAVLELKQGLIALGSGSVWSVVASCDGTTVKNIGDASPDLWADLTDIVCSTSGARSWCILENATTGGQLLIHCAYSSENDLDLYYSHTGSYTTDGTTTSAPTATESTMLFDNGQDWSPLSGNLTFVAHFMCSADNKTTRWFIDWGLGGRFGSIEHVVNPPSAWSSTNPVIVYSDVSGVTQSTTTYVQSPTTGQALNLGSWRAYIETTAPYAGWLDCQFTYEAYKSILTNADCIMLDNVEQDITGGYPVCQIGMVRPLNPKGGVLGRLRDIYLGQEAHQMLSTYPADASRAWIKWGCFVVPWSGDTPVAP